MSIGQHLKSWRRDVLAAAGPLLVLAVAGLWVAYQFGRPTPPDRVVMSTGSEDGVYHGFAKRYRDILARSGIRLELKPSSGSVQNVERLVRGEADLALVQGGTGGDAQELVSLGVVYFEPLWVFSRGPEPLDRLSQLRGKRLAVGGMGSGTTHLASALLRESGVAEDAATTVDLGGMAAAEALLAGDVDAMLMVVGAGSPVIRALLHAPGVKLMDTVLADAYARRLPYLAQVTLPAGAADLAADLPPAPVRLVAARANIVARADLHPAVVQLMMEAAAEVHGGSGVVNRAGDFPSRYDTEFPLAKDARRWYESGPPFLQRYLPFWAAVLVDRLIVLLLPLLVLLVPLFRTVPALYAWRVRSRVYRWYGELSALEVEVEKSADPQRVPEWLRQLDELDAAVKAQKVPLAYSGEKYTLREHVGLVRRRVLARTGGGAGD